MTETQLQAAIIEYAELMGWRIYHVTNVHKRLRSHTSEGFPDLHMVRGKRIVYAELKNATEKRTEEQNEWAEAIERTPAEYYLWRPGHWMSGCVDAILRRKHSEIGGE